jgi:hypothetical protein
MKTSFFILISFLVLFLIGQAYISITTEQTENHEYKVLKEYGFFQVRKYEAAIFSSVNLGKKGYKETSREGFGVLAGYIFGDNESNEKIAMTSPVVMEIGDTSKMMFMVPKAYSIKDLPNPNNNRIIFEKQDEKIVAAIQFDGWANDAKIEKYRAILKKELAKEKLQHTNKFTYLGYNPPYELFNRRNEVVVELVDYE